MLLGLAAAAWLAAREATLPGEHFPLGPRLVLAREPDRAERWFGRPLHHSLQTTLGWDLVFAAAVGAALAFGAWWFSQTFRTIDTRKLGTTLGPAGAAAAVLQVIAVGLLLLGGHAEPSIGSSIGSSIGPSAVGQRWQASAWAWHVAAVAGWGAWFVAIGVALYVAAGLLGLFTPWWVLEALYDGEDGHLPATPATLETRRLGLAISGGGVRASSMALGTLQGLEVETPTPLGWDQADKITSISGGSAMAGAWYVARHHPEVNGRKPSPDAWRLKRGDLSAEERYLRANLGFILSSAPRGSSHDRALRSDEMEAVSRRDNRPGAIATALIAFVINASVFVAVIVALGIVSGWFYRWYLGLSPALARWRCAGRLGYPVHGPDAPLPSPRATCADLVSHAQPPSYHQVLVAAMPGWSALTWLAVGGAGLMLWVCLARALAAEGTVRSGLLTLLKIVTFSALALSATCLVLLSLLPALTVGLWRPAGAFNVAAAMGATGSVYGLVKTLKAPLARFAPPIAGILFGLVLLYLYVHVTQRALAAGISTNSIRGVLGIVAALALLQLGGLNEVWSLAGFYRARLRGAFATYRRGQHSAAAFGNDAGAMEEPELAAYDDGRLALCATATVTGRDVVTHAGVPALSLTFTRDHVSLYTPLERDGAWHRFRCRTAQMAKLMPRWSPRLTTFTAVGLSSAAVSPAMGRFRVGPLSLLFTFANVRLGMWMPNPRYAAALAKRGRRLPRPRLGYLLKEFVSRHDLSDLFVYVTDGGHWENTGLVELLRDGHYGEVVVVDADSAAGNRTPSLAKAIDLARQECAATVCIDLDVFRTSPTPTPGFDYAERSVSLGLIHRPDPDRPADRLYTLLWYARADLTARTPAPLLAFRELDDTFPRTSTLHQVFTPEQFTAYRDLGRSNAAQILAARRLLAAVVDKHADFGCLKRRHSRYTGRVLDWSVDELIELIEELPPPERGLTYQQVRRALTEPFRPSDPQPGEAVAPEPVDAVR